MIEIKNLSKSYDNFLVLDNINLEIKEGEFISILGSFGCGKTTLMKIIGGLINNYKGTVKINGLNPVEI
ncbi:MAG: ATP-binding cassette domain-containing protein, partial [Bacilli bacterium]|nr:ATP-binding cassette domain-containing protein [Bacilli bacterium]